MVALFDRLDVGTTFSRRRWPAHVTLVSNFVTAASVDRIAEALRQAPGLDAPLRIEFGGRAKFGPDRDIPVRLVLPGRITELHRHLVDELVVLTDLKADEPAYWGEGYRPHLTLGASVDEGDGEPRMTTDVAIARLDGDLANVVAVIASA